MGRSAALVSAVGLGSCERRLLRARDLERLGQATTDLKLREPLGQHPDRQHAGHPRRRNDAAGAPPNASRQGVDRRLDWRHRQVAVATERHSRRRLRREAAGGHIGVELGVVGDADTGARGPEHGAPHPLAVGRLSSSYSKIDRAKSLTDPRTGDVVQPYGRYDKKAPATPGEERLYRVEFWPIGNRFREGHRLRLHILGASATSLPSAPALNSVRVGGARGSRLLLPVLPGSSLREALR